MPEDKQISEQETEEQVFILSNAGKPFKTEHTAQFTLKKKKLEATHEVVPYSDGGFAIREKVDKVDDGLKVENEKQSAESLPPQEPPRADKPARVLCPICGRTSTTANMGDKCEGSIIKDGYKQDCPGKYGEDPSLKIEKYYWVKFGPKSHPNDMENVELSCNGELLQIERMKDVCIAGRFKEIADHALQKKWDKKPGEERKIKAPIQTFPYSLIKEGTREEFVSMKKAGDQITQKHLTGTE